MNGTVPGEHFDGEHPEEDLLADLVAEALPLTQAREIEAHVLACGRCERILADAEHVRSLLRSADPGPMPDAVWARIEARLAAEMPGPVPDAPPRSRRIQTRGWFDASAPAPPGQHPPAPPPDMSFDEAPTAAWKAFLSEPPEPPPAVPVQQVQQRVNRAVRAMRSRRDVRTEDGPGRRLTRPALLIAAAATAVGVLGLGGVATMSLVGDDRPRAATDSLPGASSRGILHASGAEYTALTLAGQAKALVQTGSPNPRAASPSGTRSNSAALSKPGTVADPGQLAKCLTALGAGGRQPVAVDLARYNGREAAVIVLAGRSGGHEVWVVARDCGPGTEGYLAYKTLPG